MLKRGYKFSSKEVYKYAKLLLQAVDHLHSQKIPIIHGDIKPDNIMITPDGNLCLIDFNISGVSDNGRAYTTGFTRGYGAPDQERAFIEVAKKIKEAKKALILETVQAESTGKLSDNPKREMISDRENGKPADSDEATEYEVGEDTETIELAGNAKQNSHISASFEDKSLTGNNPSLSNSNSSIKYP